MTELSESIFTTAATGTVDQIMHGPASEAEVTEFQAKAAALGL